MQDVEITNNTTEVTKKRKHEESIQTQPPKEEEPQTKKPKISTEVTFTFDTIKMKTIDQKDYIKRATVAECIKQERDWQQMRGPILYDSSLENKGRILLPVRNRCGIIETIRYAYNNHVPFVLTPDTVWHSIMFAFGTYVTRHAEEMRDIFVSHKEKMVLTVVVEQYLSKGASKKCMEKLLDDMCAKVGENTKSEIKEWAIPTFSTTTKKDVVIAQIALMNTMKEYFQYQSCMQCGISKVTMRGTRNDWLLLYKKAERLTTYTESEGLSQWAPVLLYVLNELISSYDGKQDEKFWQSIYDHNGGSGKDEITGWCLVFSPFDSFGRCKLNTLEKVLKTKNENEKSKWPYGEAFGVIDTCSVISSSCMVPLKIDEFGDEHDGWFYAGASFVDYDVVLNELTPVSEWAFGLKEKKTKKK